MEPTIKQMILANVPRVTEIEHASFNATAWSEETFVKELTGNKFAHYYTVSLNDVIVGYFGMWIVEDHAQITTIAIAPDYRGKKLGALLLEYVMTLSAHHHVDVVSLEVRVDNEAAIGLYESFGFNYGGIRKDYYGPGKDANVMWVKVNER